jgi:hypothetical protein
MAARVVLSAPVEVVVMDHKRVLRLFVTLDGPRAVIVAVAAFLLRPAAQRHFDAAKGRAFFVCESKRGKALEEFELVFLCAHFVFRFESDPTLVLVLPVF